MKRKRFAKLRSLMRKKRRWKRPSWLFRWHQLISAFVIFCGIGMALASWQYGAIKFPALASASENLMGWIWSDPSGWISVNSDNPGACGSGSCGSYGVHLDTSSKQINGFSWSDVAGWICFGSSCSASVDCNGSPPSGALLAYLDPGVGTVQAHGWAKVCNEGDGGWISLNCAESGSCVALNPYYKVVFNPSSGYFADVSVPGTSFGWNGTNMGTGFGYMDFQLVQLRPETDPVCDDGIDNDLNGLTDCQEASCGTAADCIETPSNTNCNDGLDNDHDGMTDCQEIACSTAANCIETPSNTNCNDGLDNDHDGMTDCQEAVCQSDPVCAETPANGNKCEDGIDDDGDGLVDCVDTDCNSYPTCILIGEAACGLGLDACCSDGLDNDGSGTIDCEDMNCLLAPVCTPAWLQAKFGNVYAQKGITGEALSSGQPLSSGTYCLTTQGEITGFKSQAGCTESGSESLTLPKGATGYTGTLGSLDINGILNGRYGKIVDYTGFLPDVLNGKVYKATGNVTLTTKQFQNGTSATERGNGLLLVEGDLYIQGDLSYQTNALSQYLRNLASFGVIVKKTNTGIGGNIYIQSGVKNLVGAFFAEDTIHTGTTGATDEPLRVLGLMAAYRLDLQRNYKDLDVAAETVIFDGRAVVNPPPGMQEISKSLPTSKDAF
ncbi:MAG: hypothetical protein ABIB04_01850 [Patescibacteria group bacterium]